ncbi:6-pyruvoyl-tetrahydropterin synthase-related protein [Candidatus Leptofilum sp.]|uniref:6-pyruvoyl-tetrahydropterin synthase-related protein n=1 Tax=Candidatus Leptofilum sp. TaxID=3241576 RepID=UPI003B596629
MTRDRPLSSSNEKPGVSQRPFPRRQTPFFLFLITLLAIPVLQPLFSRQISCGFDTTFHLWRAVQVSALLEEGILFSRWAPQMAHGYGYPLFMFQSPFSAQLTAVFHQVGLSWPIALNLVYGLSIVTSGWTMWWLARTFWGNWGGLVAAVAYLYAPFHAYVAFYRASLSETVAWSLLPLVLWGLYRWQRDKSGWGLVTAVFSFILLIYTHDVTAYAFLPLFVGWIGLWGWVDGRSWQMLVRGVLGLLLGIGGTAFFWLPAIVERSAIQFGRANSAWPFLYVNNFLPLEQLFALPRNADPSLLNDWPPRGLGILLLIVALAGAGLAWRRAKASRWLVGFLLLGLAGYLFLTVQASEFLWTAVPQLAAFQFPWRFLAPASFLAAFLCGGVVYPQISQINADLSFSPPRLRASALTLLVVVTLSVGHWGWLYPDVCDAPDDLTVAGMVAWEQATQTLGSTASGELLPRAVEIVPPPSNPPAWQARLDPTTLPTEANILSINHQPLATQIELETAVPFTATLRIFNFPGWQVTINDESVPITPSDPEGWITFPVPNGRATIQATFRETPLRLVADAASLLSLILLTAIIWSRQGNQYSAFSNQSSNYQTLITDYWPLVTVALLLIVAKLLLVDAGGTPLRQARLQDDTLAGVAQPMDVTLGTPDNPAQVRLLGLEEWETAVPANNPLTLILYWQALQPLSANYKIGLTLLDENGRRWSDEGLRDYRWLRNPPPTTGWPTDQYALTAYFVDLLPGTPPGNYQLQLSFFEETSLTPLTFYNASGQPIGSQLDLGSVIIEPPTDPWPTSLTMQHRLEVTNGSATLLGSNLDRTEAAPGDSMLVTLFWTAQAETAVTLSLIDESEKAVTNRPITWQNFGEGAWRSQIPLQLPVSLANGRYQWQLTFPNGQAVRWGELTITAPDRLREMPVVETAVNITLSEQATLVGFSLDEQSLAAGETLNLELVWRAETELSESYRVFVHLLAGDGRIVAQSDGLPAGWTRPTTGWLPGEFIVDPHAIPLPATLPPGDYTLTTGLYLPNASRLQQPNGRDNIPLTTFTLP